MNKVLEDRGITLIALIITIIVLLILAVVTINSIEDRGIISYSQKAATEYNEEKIKEEVSMYSMEYYMRNKRSMQKTTSDKMIDICITLGILPEQLTVYYDLYNANQNKANKNSELQEEYVLYRIDKTTEEERTILEQNGIKALRGDVDLDGVLTENDAHIIELYDGWDPEIREKLNGTQQLEIADLDGDTEATVFDSAYIYCYINGDDSYSGGYAN